MKATLNKPGSRRPRWSGLSLKALGLARYTREYRASRRATIRPVPLRRKLNGDWCRWTGLSRKTLGAAEYFRQWKALRRAVKRLDQDGRKI